MAKPRGENLRTVILDSAESLILVSDLHEVTLASIADFAKVSKGTIYHYYKTKEEIFLDLTERFLDRQWEELVNWTADTQKDTSFPRLLRYVLERAISHPTLRLCMVIKAIEGNCQIKDRLIEKYSKFVKLIAEKIEERNHKDSQYLSWLIILMCDGIIVQLKLGNTNFDVEKFLGDSVKFMSSFC